MENVFDLLKKAFELYKQKFASFAILAVLSMAIFLAIIPFAATFLIAALISNPGIFSGEFNVGIPLLVFGILLGLAAITVIAVLSLWVFTASLVVVKSKDKITLEEAFKIAWQMLPSLFFINLLYGLAVLAGFLLLVIPAIIFGIWFSLSTYIFVVEGIRGKEALKKSRQLVKGNWWPIFGRFAILFVAGIITSNLNFIGFLIDMFFLYPYSLVFGYLIYQELNVANKQSY